MLFTTLPFGRFGTQAVSQGRCMCELWWVEWYWEIDFCSECIAIPCQYDSQSTNSPFSNSLTIDAVHAVGSDGNAFPSATKVPMPKNVCCNLKKLIFVFVEGCCIISPHLSSKPSQTKIKSSGSLHGYLTRFTSSYLGLTDELYMGIKELEVKSPGSSVGSV